MNTDLEHYLTKKHDDVVDDIEKMYLNILNNQGKSPTETFKNNSDTIYQMYSIIDYIEKFKSLFFHDEKQREIYVEKINDTTINIDYLFGKHNNKFSCELLNVAINEEHTGLIRKLVEFESPDIVFFDKRYNILTITTKNIDIVRYIVDVSIKRNQKLLELGWLIENNKHWKNKKIHEYTITQIPNNLIVHVDSKSIINNETYKQIQAMHGQICTMYEQMTHRVQRYDNTILLLINEFFNRVTSYNESITKYEEHIELNEYFHEINTRDKTYGYCDDLYYYDYENTILYESIINGRIDLIEKIIDMHEKKQINCNIPCYIFKESVALSTIYYLIYLEESKGIRLFDFNFIIENYNKYKTQKLYSYMQSKIDPEINYFKQVESILNHILIKDLGNIVTSYMP